ncbi:MAG: malonyl-CoA synthase [Alphaproteobacteria bacterium]|nr:malonyl-CoA synthase [Alphaproteobacteria bacterium]
MTNTLFDALFGPHIGSERPFLELPTGDVWTYDAFLQRAAQIAHVIDAAGLRPGDRLALQAAKSPWALAVYAACVQSGVVFLPLNTAYTSDEVAYFVRDATPKLLICDPKSEPSLNPIATQAGATLLTLSGDGSGGLPESASAKPTRYETRARTAADLAAFLYTSGTTGRSKGAMLTQGNLLSNAEALTRAWAFDQSDALLHALPIFHTHGLFVATNVSLLAGGRMIFLPGFNADAMISGLARATVMMGVPTFYTRLLDDPRLSRDLVAHIRLFVSGSAPLLAETHRAFEARTGHRILERYGMTETNMIASNPYDGDRKPGTVGKPLPGVELRIAGRNDGDDNGGDAESGAIGEIEVRGPNVFIGYWNMPEKTAEEFSADGFFRTGDLGQIDEDGYLQIVGRSKDLIISGGYNIYPKEIELLLDDQEGVLESAVIGVPHPDFGEGVVGVLAPEPERNLTTAAIAEAIAPKIARFKQPKALFVVNELPRNTMGKVQKALLREQYAATFSASS